MEKSQNLIPPLVGTGSSTLADIPSEFSTQLHLMLVFAPWLALPIQIAQIVNSSSASANSTFLDQQYTV